MELEGEEVVEDGTDDGTDEAVEAVEEMSAMTAAASLRRELFLLLLGPVAVPLVSLMMSRARCLSFMLALLGDMGGCGLSGRVGLTGRALAADCPGGNG